MVADARPVGVFQPVIDSSVHPLPPNAEDLREYVPSPWNRKFWPGTERYHFPHPTSEYLDWARPPSGLPGSDPELAARHLFDERKIDIAVLLPLTRGLIPDVDLGTAVCAGTNRWLAERWLGEGGSTERFRGSIRVNPMDPQGAVREIETWAGHPRMVQVAVPMEAHAPYGQRQYFPIWEAAARHGLPVAVHPDFAPGVEFCPSPVGYPRWYAEFASFYSGTYFYHLSSLIAEGVFDRLESLMFVFADGGLDLLMPAMWRLDEHWRALRFEHPWVQRVPSLCLAEHVRFCTHRMEGPERAEHRASWFEISRGQELAIYGSNYPHWTFGEPDDLVPAELGAPARGRVLWDNAAAIYGLEAGSAAGAD